MRTLIRLPNWVGDTLLALPALEGLAASGPVVLAGRALPLELTDHIAPAAQRLRLRRDRGAGLSLWEAARAARAARVDRAVLFTPSFSAALFARLAGARERFGWDEQGRGWLLNRRVPRAARGTVHITEEFRDLARRAGASEVAGRPRLPVDQEAHARAREYLRRLPAAGKGRRLALCPGVHYGWAKQWPAAAFAELRRLAEADGWGGLVVGAAGEAALAAQVLDGAGAGWSSATGAGSLRFAAELLRSCDAAVCNDTGTLHLAAAVDTPVVALFGPSEPAWTGPLAERAAVLRGACDCSPCFRRACDLGRPAPCMAAILPDQVLAAVNALPGTEG